MSAIMYGPSYSSLNRSVITSIVIEIPSSLEIGLYNNQMVWHLIYVSAAALRSRLSKFRAIQQLLVFISRHEETWDEIRADFP